MDLFCWSYLYWNPRFHKEVFLRSVSRVQTGGEILLKNTGCRSICTISIFLDSTHMGLCGLAQGAQLGALWWPRGVHWGAVGGRPKRKEIYVYI